MIKSKFKKLIALASSAAMVVSTLVPVATAAETPQVVQPSETAYIDGTSEQGLPHPGELFANYSKPDGYGEIFEHGDSKDNVGQTALVKFDLSQYVGKIRSAQLSFHSACTVADKNSIVYVASTGAEWDQDSVTWNDQTGLAPISQIGSSVEYIGSGGADIQLDVTDVVRSDEDGLVSYAFYTNQGRQQQLSNVQLNLVVSDEVIPQTTVTVNNVLEDDTVIATYTVENVYIGDTFNATLEMTADKTYNENTYTMAEGAVTSIDSVTEGAVLDIPFVLLEQRVFVKENFENSSVGTWGFSTGTGVSLGSADGNSYLRLCTTNGSGATDIKTFDESFRDEKYIEVSFRWKTEVDLTVSKTRYSYLNIVDDNGNILFGISGSDARTDKGYIPKVAYGFSSDLMSYTQVSSSDGNFYTITLNINFETQKMSGKILNSANAEVASFSDVDITAENISALRATNGGSLAPMAIDDFQIIEAKKQNVEFTVTDTENKALSGVAVAIGNETVVTDENGVATFRLIAGTYNATITKAQYATAIREVVVGEEDVKIPITMEQVSDEDFVADVIANMDIENGTTVVKNGETYTVTGDFTLPNPNNVTVEWTTDSTDGQVVINGTNAVVYPQQDKGTAVTLTAKVTYGSASDDVSFTLDLADYLSTITTAVNNAAASEAVYPYDDQNGTYAMDVYAFSKFTAENPLSFDLYLPSTVAGVEDTHISQSWESSDEDHLAIDAANNKGAIGADDMEAHDVTLTKTVSYIKDGVTLASKEVEYTVPVQFDPDTLEDRVDAWAEAYAATQDAESTTSDKYTTAYNNVYNAFMRQYQLRFDAAYDGNFSNMPEEETNISTSGISDLNYEGFFGSSIEWASSQSTYASVSQSNRRVTINRSSFSGTRDITITATIYLPSYTETATRAFDYEITGTRSTGGTGTPGSTGNTGSTSVMPVRPTATPTATRTPASEAFDDIEGVESWAGDAIRELYDEGIVSGKGDNKFAPYDNVTRGEFAKMIVGTFGLNEMPDEYRGFTDVPSGNWCFTYVEIAAAAGVVNGYEDGSFGLNDNITRQDMAVMVVRAAEAAGVTITDNGSSVDFGDADSIADYAVEAVNSLVSAGIINGIDGNFEPASNANRAQAAKILANFLD